MKKITNILSLFVVFMIIFTNIQPVYASTARATTMRLEKTTGTVTVKNLNGTTRTKTNGMRLFNGNKILTASGSEAYISLDSSKAVKLSQNGEASLNQRGKKLEITVKKGQLFFNVSQSLKSDESMNIRTSTMVTGVRGTCGVVDVVSKDQTAIYMLEGSISYTVTDPATGMRTEIAVRGGEKLVMTKTDNEKSSDVEPLDITEIPLFALEEVAADKSLQEKIEANTDLKVNEMLDYYDSQTKGPEQQTAVPEAPAEAADEKKPDTESNTSEEQEKTDEKENEDKTTTDSTVTTSHSSSSHSSSSHSSSTSSSNTSRNSSTTGANVGGYKTDERFASGYPKYEVDSTMKKVTVTYKLADAVDVSEEKPVELFTVAGCNIYDIDYYKTNSEAVLHGHFGITSGNVDQPVSVAFIGAGYQKFTDHEEKTYTYSSRYYTNMTFMELAVLKDAAGTVSEVPTMTGEYEGTASSNGYAGIEYAYLDETGKKVYLYVMGEELNTDIVPAPQSFSVKSDNNTSVSAVASGISMTSLPYSNCKTCIELTFDQALTIDNSDNGYSYYMIYYEKPEASPLTSQSGYVLYSQQSQMIRESGLSIANVFYSGAADGASGYYVGIHLKNCPDLYVLDGTSTKPYTSGWLVEINGTDYPYSEYLTNIPDVPGSVVIKPNGSNKIVGGDRKEYDKLEAESSVIQQLDQAVIESANYDSKLCKLEVTLNDVFTTSNRGSSMLYDFGQGCNFIFKDSTTGKEYRARGELDTYTGTTIYFSEEQLAAAGITAENAGNYTVSAAVYDNCPDAGVINAAGRPCASTEIPLNVVSSDAEIRVYSYGNTELSSESPDLVDSTQEEPAIVEGDELSLSAYISSESGASSATYGTRNWNWSVKNLNEASGNTATLEEDVSMNSDDRDADMKLKVSARSEDTYEVTVSTANLTKKIYVQFPAE